MCDLNSIENIILPNWSAPKNVCALTTTRYIPKHSPQNAQQNISQNVSLNFAQNPLNSKATASSYESVYADFNLAAHVGDEVSRVVHHRQILQNVLNLPQQPVWLNQQHTDKLLPLKALNSEQSILDSVATYQSLPEMDASWTHHRAAVCVVMTADCLPILLSDLQGEIVCAIHAGWQGVYKGIIEKTLQQLPKPACEFVAWIGPAISQKHFEVGVDFYQKFMSLPAGKDYQPYFQASSQNAQKYFADLAGMAKLQLEKVGVADVSLSGLCSYQDERFYSYRQACHQGDGKTGRIATLIWMDA